MFGGNRNEQVSEVPLMLPVSLCVKDIAPSSGQTKIRALHRYRFSWNCHPFSYTENFVRFQHTPLSLASSAWHHIVVYGILYRDQFHQCNIWYTYKLDYTMCHNSTPGCQSIEYIIFKQVYYNMIYYICTQIMKSQGNPEQFVDNVFWTFSLSCK